MADRQDDDEVHHPRTQDDQHQDRQQNEGESQLHIGKAHDHVVQAAAEIAADDAQGDAQETADGDRRDAYRQRDARAIDEPRQHIPAKPVGTENERKGSVGDLDLGHGRLEAQDQILAVGIGRGQLRCEERSDHQEQQDCNRQQGPARP